MPYIEFTALGDLTAFLTACRTRGEALGQNRNRAKFSDVHFAPNASYSIVFQPTDWVNWDKPEQFHYGGKIVKDGVPAGTVVKLDDLLLHLPLRSRRDHIKIHALVLAVQSRAGSRGEPPLEILHRAWRDVPKREGAESRFFTRESGNGTGEWFAVEIRDVASQFDGDAFREAHPDLALTVFAPAWQEESCFLYVEWGYAYPKPQEFACLYDDQRGGEPELVLARAGGPVAGLRDATSTTWYHADWLRVALKSYSLAENFYELELTRDIRLVEFPAVELEESERLHVELQIGGARHLIGETADLDLRIARCGRELEELLTRKARLAHQAQLSWLPVHMFHQAKDERLPEKLQLFLARPLGELARYRYYCVPLESGRRHFIVCEAPMPWGAAVAVPSDQTWLCDARWREWGLPLFLRSDCVLSVHVDEQNMAGKVREKLEAAEFDFGTERTLVLAEPTGPEGGMRFQQIHPEVELDKALGFLNEADGSVAVLADAAGSRLEAQVTAPDVEVSESVRQLDEKFHERAQALLGELERHWQTARDQATDVLLRLRIVEAAAELGNQACEEGARGWPEFLNRALTIDERISRLKLDAAAAWTADQAVREQRTRNIELAQQSFAAELTRSKAQLTQFRSELRREQEEMDKQISEIGRIHAEAETEEKQLADRAQRLEEKNRAAKVTLEKLTHDEGKARQTIEQFKKRAQECRDLREKISRQAEEIMRAERALDRDSEEQSAGVARLRETGEMALRLAASLEKPKTFGARLRRLFGGR